MVTRMCESCVPEIYDESDVRHCKLWHGLNKCKVCRGFDVSLPDRPDVYFRHPYFDPFIADPDTPGHEHGSWIESKRHKAILLKAFKLREAGGDRRNFDKIAHRHAMASLRR